MMLPKLQILAGTIVTCAQAFQLKDASHYQVNRQSLEKSYPAYKSFKGLMHAGLMPAALRDDENAINDDYSSYFFWLFRPDVVDSSSDTSTKKETAETFRNDTLLIWFNGGPGCSSMVGLMGEMGPVGVPKFGPGIPAPNPLTLIDAPLVANEYAWTKKSAMLFVEQPGGTGFSTASKEWSGKEADKRTEDDVASAFYAFLQNIYTVFGDDLAQKRLYLTGESYAGMYIPSIARGIHLRNKKLPSSSSLRHINLSGAAIGNGWIDVKIQGPTTIDFAWWHGMIDLQTYRGLHEKWDKCMNDQIVDKSEKPFHPFNTPDECGISSAVMQASGSKFMYEVTTYDAYPDVLNEGGTISNFFNDPVVREALNAPDMEAHKHWRACVPGSGRRRLLEEGQNQRELILLEHDMPLSLSVVPYIAELLDDAHIDILMYNGDLDLACSPQSTELSLESMDWSGAEEWKDPDTTKWQQWNVDGAPAGHTKSFGNLQFLVVYNSGHFVPINQARNSLNMIGRLIDGQSLGDKRLAMFPSQEGKESLVETEADTHANPRQSTNHGLTLLTGLTGFLLGVLVSHLVAKRHFRRYSDSSSSSSLQATETTPLHHNGEA